MPLPETILSSLHVSHGSAGYDVLVGAGAAVRLGELTQADENGIDRVAMVADESVLELHGTPDLGEDLPLLALPGGEEIKTLGVLERVLNFCAEARLSRSSLLVAYGGGTIGDLTGLSASLFKRGLRVAQIPTTLLSQVDASVGGKTAINLSAGKNLAGTFHHPFAVFCDTTLPVTLSDLEFQSGLGEVIKTALIGGEANLAALEHHAIALTERDQGALGTIVAECIATKARIVAADPEERGLRRVLNLGHTFGHAIEHAAGYGRVPHGIAVAVGLMLASRAAALAGMEEADVSERLRALYSTFELPASLGALRERFDLEAELTPDKLVFGLAQDKKGAVGDPEFVLLRAPGRVELGVRLGQGQLSELLA